ncbi:MAG TPA: DNA polymerase ligase N-terminal domain-containing protein [Thermoanaerobaculia bacterium]|nr:DNA polymerase ligase N-terminal domain-containing protein [Thermoanaerobaculia bacterium]
MPDLLKKYRKMRDFGVTPEPAGGKPKKRKLPIFVIQKHRASHLHYDFRLEMEGVLKSWAVPKGPSYDPGTKRLAMMTEDHPYDYAKFEGVIPEGNYGAGNVIIWDEGGWEFIEPGDDPVAAVKSGKLTFRMFGKKMFGEWALVRIGGRSKSDKGNEWLLLKHRDEFANANVDVTKVAPRSVVSNKLVEEIGGENVWQSNRKASSRKAPTLADKLSTPKKKRAAPAKASAAKAKKAPSRAASSRSRSSPAAAKRSTRTTARRRPR